MCMKKTPNVLERPKLLRFKGMDVLINQMALYHGVTYGDNLEIQNTAIWKQKTSQNWKREKRFTSTL